MRGLLVFLVATSGCQLVFPLNPAPDAEPDAEVEPPKPNRPFGCSPASLLNDGFPGAIGPHSAGRGRSWG